MLQNAKETRPIVFFRVLTQTELAKVLEACSQAAVAADTNTGSGSTKICLQGMTERVRRVGFSGTPHKLSCCGLHAYCAVMLGLGCVCRSCCSTVVSEICNH